MKNHYTIQFSELSLEAQTPILDSIVEELYSRAKNESEANLLDDVLIAKGVTWQESYMRSYDIDWRMWNNWKPGQAEDWYNWDDELKEELNRQAEVIATRHFAQTEIQVII